jgi:hypothetical protein
MKKMIKVGKYTAALILVIVGSLLLIDLTTNTEFTGELLNWWPAVIILLGVEYLFISLIYRGPDRRIGFAVGSLILSIVLSIVVISYTTFPNINILNSINIGNISFSDKTSTPYDKGMTNIPVTEKHDKVHIYNPNGDIQIVSGQVDQIQVATTIYVNKLSNEEADDIVNNSNVTFEESGSTLKIEAEGKEYRVFGIKQKPRMDLVITVPSHIVVDYDLDMKNGKLIATDITTTDHFKIKTTNGSIQVNNMVGDIFAQTTNGKVLAENVQGDVDLDTTNGSITTNIVEGDVKAATTNGKISGSTLAGSVDVSSTNGSITLTDVLEDVEANTTNGSITIHTKSIGGDWELDTTHGKISIYVPDDSNFEVEGSGGNKDIHSDFPLKITGRDVSGTVGNGKHEIKLDTNSGIGIYKNS